MKRGTLPVGLVTIAMLASAGSSDAAKGGTGKVRIRGGTVERFGVCPVKRRRVVVARPGQKVRVRVRRRRGARAVVSKCVNSG